MNTSKLVFATMAAASLSAVCLAAAGDDAPAAGPTRSQVGTETLQARADGELFPAGEAAQWVADQRFAASVYRKSALARGRMRADVMQARANGELIPAGEGVTPQDPVPTSRRATGYAGVQR